MRFLKVNTHISEKLFNLSFVKTVGMAEFNGKCIVMVRFSDDSEPCKYQFDTLKEAKRNITYVDL